MEQLALLEPAPPKLTDRQNTLHQALQNAGTDGLTPQQAGQVLGAHPDYQTRDGRQVLQALRKKGLVAERRKPYSHWVSVGAKGRADFGEVPY